MGKTLFEKIWDRHLVASIDESTNLIFIDLHLVHEVTSPQAFDSLRLAGRKVKHPEMTLATVDHGVPTSNRLLGINCLLYTSPSPRDISGSRMPSSA